MEKIYILGTTKYSFMIHQMILQENAYDVLGHTVSEFDVERYRNICRKNNTNIVALEDLFDQVHKGENVKILNTLGYSKMNTVRQKLYQLCNSHGVESVSYISSRATVLSNDIGKSVIILPTAYIGPSVRIGNNTTIYSMAVLTHDIKVGENCFIAANVTCGGEVKIQDNCFIGMGATIKNQITLAPFTLVGAGAYVAKDSGIYDVVVPVRSVTLEKKSIEVSINTNVRGKNG